MRAVYCKCKNTYSIDCKNNNDKNCKTPEYWKQGIGRISAIPPEPVYQPLTDVTFNQASHMTILAQEPVTGDY